MKNPRLGRGMFILVIAGVLPASGGANAKNRAGDQTSTIFLGSIINVGVRQRA